jgi:vancomycin resistance protein YoaR
MKKNNLLKKLDASRHQSQEVNFSAHWVIYVLAALLTLSVALIVFVFAFDRAHQSKIYPGTRIGDIDLSNLSLAEAQDLLQPRVQEIVDQGLTISFNGENFVIPATLSDAANPDLVSSVLTFDLTKTVNDIKAQQDQRNEAERLFYWLSGYQAVPSFRLDEGKFVQLLSEKLNVFQQPAQNASLVIGDGDTINIEPEHGGQAFDYEGIVAAAKRNMARLANDKIIVELKEDIPEITSAQAETLLDLAIQVLSAAPFQLVYDDRSWELSRDQVREWLEFQLVDGRPVVGLNRTSLGDYLQQIANEINVPVKEGKFSMADGKVKEFQPSQDGLELQTEDSSLTIINKITQVGVKEVDLSVVVTKPATNMGDINDLGINELVGEGHSNFKGSPKNRRHNISVGANTLNGILIKPGEEFSLVKALGKIEASTGYLPELVIKGNKTIPEYGGGLCQIGTTTFRAALDAGLPILERKNHSYRVSYYEPAGTDATIYDPKPDFRFLNDSGHYILFTTEIAGDDLYFRFYGTRDGRMVTQTTPRVFNQVRPGSTRLIETLDLKPGEKKCIEKAHTGADTEFSRTVIYSSGEKKVDVFKSHYKPWQEVCLVGVEKLSE